MAVTAPETAVRERLVELLTKEFKVEAVVIESGRIHESLGVNGPIGGVYPAMSTEARAQGLVLETVVYVQLFRQWTPEVKPEETIDSAPIEEWAERLRRACKADTAGGSQHMWYYVVQKIEYPADPAGNISRLQATILARSQNSALVETNG